MLVEEGICLSWSSAPSLFRSRVPGICFRLHLMTLFVWKNELGRRAVIVVPA